MKERVPEATELGELNFVEATQIKDEIWQETHDARLKVHPEGYFEIGDKRIEFARFVEVEGKELPMKVFLKAVLEAMVEEDEKEVA